MSFYTEHYKDKLGLRTVRQALYSYSHICQNYAGFFHKHPTILCFTFYEVNSTQLYWWYCSL